MAHMSKNVVVKVRECHSCLSQSQSIIWNSLGTSPPIGGE